jgi:hypothetical protein
MSILRVYGNSFFADPYPDIPSITGLLSKKLNIPMINHAIIGASTDYGYLTFINDVKNKVIQDNDIIIFAIGNPNRLNFKHQNRLRPETGEKYLHYPPDDGKDHSWYFENRKNIRWWMVNQDQDFMKLNYESYVCVIKNLAQLYPKIKFIVMHGFAPTSNLPEIPATPNFLESKIAIWDIVAIEYGTGVHYKNWIKNTIWDPRSNHLTIPNIHIMTDLLEESIKNLSVDNITIDKFQTNLLEHIIESVDQYHNYISKGYLYGNNELYNRIVTKLLANE